VAEVYFIDAALDDLRRIGPDAVPRVLKKVLALETDPLAGHPLGGELTGYRKLVVGKNTWHIVYRTVDEGQSVEICEVWAVGLRSDRQVYEESIARARGAARARPELVHLAEVVARLGKLSGAVDSTAPRIPREPVPGWLAERLVHTAGMPREKVAALDAQQALEEWTAFVSRPPPAGP